MDGLFNEPDIPIANVQRSPTAPKSHQTPTAFDRWFVESWSVGAVYACDLRHQRGP